MVPASILHRFHRIVLVILLFGILAACRLRAQDGGWGPAPGARPAYSVVYTGRLYGYFRYPEEQATSQSGCPVFSEPQASPQVRRILDALRTLRLPEDHLHLLVSMGDDFAPELLSRTMRNADPSSPESGQLLLKDLFSPDPAGSAWLPAASDGSPRKPQALNRGAVPSDNVGCFFRLAGFDAAVPGQQDFAFGPDRLRELARFLAEPGDSVYRPVQMLAANLAIVSSVHGSRPPFPAGALPLPVQQALAPRANPSIALPAAVMPWLRTVSVTTTDETASVFDCPAKPEDPRDFDLPTRKGNACTRLSSAGTGHNVFALDKAVHPSVNFLDYYTLDPGTNHALCVEFQDGKKPEVSCKLFSVQYPLLQYRPDTSGATPAPYYLSPAGAAGPRVAIFGVMDPGLIGYIGQFRYTYMNRDRSFDTRLQIGDPAEALRQIVGLCEATPVCAGARKILLAQMPVSKALQLAATTDGFDLVVAQSDYEHATGTQTRSRVLSARSHPDVLAPGFVFDSARDNALSVNLRRADLYLESAGPDQATREHLANRVEDDPVPAPALRPGGLRNLQAAVAAAVAGPAEGAAAANYEQIALLSMRQFCGTDVALLQHRDIFSGLEKAVAYWPPGRSYGVQQLLDEVLWNGEFVFCLPVKGSTLKKMLQESAHFDQQDRDRLSLETQRGRGLATLGIMTSGAGPNQPVIRGQPVDDNQLYGVAMTDYLAFGDTGYPELSSEAVLPRVRITSVGTLHRLTGFACERASVGAAADCPDARPIDSPDFFDPIVQTPFDTNAGLSALQQFRHWLRSPLQLHSGATTLFGAREAQETQAPYHGSWWFTLQNLSAEYDLTFIRGSDKTIPANFSGINTFSQLSTPESSKLGLWTRVRGGYQFPRYFDFFAAGEEKVTYAAVRIPNLSGNGDFGPYQGTLADNLVRSEIGLLSKPAWRRAPFRILLSENLLTQVTNPFLDLFEVPPCGTPGCIPQATIFPVRNLGKNYLLMTRLGARLQNENSANWFEAGREYGENFGIPIGFSLQDPGRAQPFSCSLAGNLSLTQCIYSDPLFNVQSQVLPNLQNQPISGWFTDFHIAVPLFPSKLQLTVDSYGELFDRRQQDTSFNTRFYEDLTTSLKIPLWGNLTFAPQVEVFFFQNKVIPGQSLLTNHYTFVTSSLKLEYQFAWRRGVGIKRALRYPGGASTAASPGSPLP